MNIAFLKRFISILETEYFRSITKSARIWKFRMGKQDGGHWIEFSSYSAFSFCSLIIINRLLSTVVIYVRRYTDSEFRICWLWNVNLNLKLHHGRLKMAGWMLILKFKLVVSKWWMILVSTAPWYTELGSPVLPMLYKEGTYLY